MSTSLEKRQRVQHDAYFTPPELTRALFGYLDRDGWLPECESPRVLEPSSGRGAFVAAARDFLPGARITAVDLSPPLSMLAKPDLQLVGDFLSYEDPTGSGFDLVVGNPPFGKPHPKGKVSTRTGEVISVPAAEEHVRKALSLLAPHGVLAFLLRLSFLESTDRAAFWNAFPAESIYAFSQRPSFIGGGTDNSAYAFFVWQSRARGRMRTEVISWR